MNDIRIYIRETVNKILKESKVDNILYHGSKYKFNKFDITKINTGQHSQDFGYGLYFTTNKKTAIFYANELSNFKTPIEKYNELIKSSDDNILYEYLKDNKILSAKRRLNDLINNDKDNNEWKILLNHLDKIERYGYVYTIQIINQNFISKNDYNVMKNKLNISDKEMNNVLLKQGYNGIIYPINSFNIDKENDYSGEYNVVIIDDEIIKIKNVEKYDFEGYLKLKNI